MLTEANMKCNFDLSYPVLVGLNLILYLNESKLVVFACWNKVPIRTPNTFYKPNKSSCLKMVPLLSKRMTLVFVLMVFALSFTVLYFYISNLPRRTDVQRLENYARRYLEEYKKLVHTWGNESEFEFFEGYPYHALGVISEVHGAAIFFTRSSQQEIEIITYPERIEFYLWPEMKKWWDNATTYFKGKENEVAVFLDDYTIEVAPGGHVEIEGTLIYENRMILKGSNEEKLWLPEVGMIDATNEFLRVAKSIVLSEAEAEEVQGVALLRAKAEEIARNEKAGAYRDNLWLRAKHEEEFWDLAEERGIRSDTAKQIKSQTLTIYKEQPIYQPSLQPIIDSLVGSSIFTGIVYALRELYEKKLKKRSLEKDDKGKPKKKRKKRRRRKVHS